MVFSCARHQARHHIMKAAVLVSLLGFLVNLDCVAGNVIYKSINWVPQNPIFMADGKTCGPGARNIAVQLQSKLHFICPNTATFLESSLVGVQPADMYENLWLLYNKTAFDKCDASLDPNRRLLLSCKTPMKLSFFPVLFAQYTGEPNGLIFEGGRWYYFIATSDGTESHLYRTRGGHCNDTTNKVHMKLAVYVCKKSNATYTDPKCSSGDVGVIQCPQIPTVAATTTTTTTTPATTAPQITEEDNTKSSEPTSTPSVTETASRTVKATPATDGNNNAPVCNKPIDLGLVMDKTAGNFNVVKEFARILAGKFQISDQGTHLGAIAFDSQADLLLLFSDLKGSANNLEGVNKQINKWGPGSPGEEGMITEGLSVANRFLFSVRSGMRPGKKADKVLVLLTDGIQNKGLEKDTPQELTRKMTKRGIKLFVIGIGPADPIELWEIAGLPQSDAKVYNIIRDGGMSPKTVAEKIAESLCN